MIPLHTLSARHIAQAVQRREITVEAVTREFETHRFGATYEEGEFAEGDVDHFRAVVGAAVNWQAKIDQLTDRVRTRVAEIRELGRATQGVTLIGLDDGAKLSGLQRIVENDANDANDAEANGDPETDAGPAGEENNS